jgi:hydrogenase maturation protease
MAETKSSPLLVMGIGNPILTDDSIGLKIARGLKERRPNLDIVETMETGVGILDVIAGYERLIAIDSIKTGKESPGFLYRLEMTKNDPSVNLSCAHGVDIISAIRLGRILGFMVPRDVMIYAVEISDNTTFGETCTPVVEDRLLSIIEEILKDLDQRPSLTGQ